MKVANRYMKNFISCFSRKKFIWSNLIFLAFRPFFTIWLGMVKLSQATVNWNLKQSGHDFFHDYYWILKQSGHYFFHDYYWILKQSGHDFFHDYYWILKQSRHDFSNKHLCDGYCMDIMWYLCVKVKIHGFVRLH